MVGVRRLAVPALLVLLLAGGCTSAPSRTGPATTTSGGAHPTSPPRSGPGPDPSAALAAYVASTAARLGAAARRAGAVPFAAVHSAPVPDDGVLSAVAAFTYSPDGRPVQVLAFRGGRWAAEAGLAPPAGGPPGPTLDLVPGTEVETADATGDGRPDFLVHLLGGDSTFAAVVSQDGGGSGWRYVPMRGPYPTSTVLGRDPRFRGAALVSGYNDCTPSCAAGHVTDLAWTYQADVGQFWAPDPPGWQPSAEAYNHQIGPSGSVTVQTGFGGTEAFCATGGVTGSVVYAASGGSVTMTVDVAGLPPRAQVGVNWLNDPVRGYNIAAFETDGSGRAQESTLRLFRPGEKRGYRLQLAAVDTAGTVLGWLDPCPTQTAPDLAPALTTVHPTVTVTPAGGLRDGQRVRVRVTGFGVGGKVWLSECGGGAVPTDLGCGEAPPAQTLLVTGDDRTATGTFVVRGAGPTTPGAGPASPCRPTCTLVATAGIGYGYASSAVTTG